MNIIYRYEGKDYSNPYYLRKPIWEKQKKIIRIPTDNFVDEWAKYGVEYIEVKPSEEETAKEEFLRALESRDREVSGIVVNVDGMQFNGDEESQRRIAIALKVAEITGKTEWQWVLANNEVKTVTTKQLEEVLIQASEQLENLWPEPHLEKEPNNAQ